jgi:hypothetical protein
MNSIEAISVGKIFDENSIAVTEVEIVTTALMSMFLSVRRDTVKKAREQVIALIGSELNQQAEIDELRKRSSLHNIRRGDYSGTDSTKNGFERF